MGNAAAHLIGAATYTGWAGYWPGASGPFATPMNEIPKIVFSNSLASADWGETTIAAGDLAEAVTRLKQERPDGPFATGTGPLVSGSTLALVMSMAGHVSYLAELDGPGVQTLRSRLQPTAA